jgi:hypothetical protein
MGIVLGLTLCVAFWYLSQVTRKSQPKMRAVPGKEADEMPGQASRHVRDLACDKMERRREPIALTAL